MKLSHPTNRPSSIRDRAATTELLPRKPSKRLINVCSVSPVDANVGRSVDQFVWRPRDHQADAQRHVVSFLGRQQPPRALLVKSRPDQLHIDISELVWFGDTAIVLQPTPLPTPISSSSKSGCCSVEPFTRLGSISV